MCLAVSKADICLFVALYSIGECVSHSSSALLFTNNGFCVCVCVCCLYLLFSPLIFISLVTIFLSYSGRELRAGVLPLKSAPEEKQDTVTERETATEADTRTAAATKRNWDEEIDKIFDED